MLALRRELPTVHAVANASVLSYGNKRERLMLDNDDAKAVISRKKSGHLHATSDHESDQGMHFPRLNMSFMFKHCPGRLLMIPYLELDDIV